MFSKKLLFIALVFLGFPGTSFAENLRALTSSVTEQNDQNDRELASGFRLKLYWEKGYYWQEETIERRWCLCCRGGCHSGASLDIHNCDDGRGDKFEFLGSGKEQIKLVGKNLCMALVGRDDIQLATCDSKSDRQKFTAGKGDFNGRRFEFNPVVNGGCVSNSHHPRDGEVIYRQTCERSERSTTSYWVRYK